MIIFMILLYLVGVYINPEFFGSADALSPRSCAMPRAMASWRSGMTFVIVNKDLDLSVGSIYGLIGGGLLDRLLAFLLSTAASSRRSSGRVGDRPPRRAHQRHARDVPAGAGLHRDAHHAVHRARHRYRPHRRQDHLLRRQGQATSLRSSRSARTMPGASTTRSSSSSSFAVVGAIVLAKTRWGYRDLCDRRQRARRHLCRHPDALGAHARLSAVGVLRHHRRADAGGPGHAA